ncbi:MAG: phosphodiester glycosidase family protein [Limnochordia bacterium]|nr:phosphodiester glycosidase family protein [Limnochordia bacterium]
MLSRGRILVVVVSVFLITLVVNTAVAQTVVVSPEYIWLSLPKAPGQVYNVSYTTSPMKVIIDSNLPIPDDHGSRPIKDVALKDIRHVEVTNGWRMVLDFNYQIPLGQVWEDEEVFRLEIPKTFANTSRRLVDQGIFYGHQRRADVFGPNVVNYLEIDLWYGFDVKLALAQDRLFGSEQVSGMAQRTGAIAAVNGAFFAGTGRPLGLFMIDGQLMSEPYANRTALGLGPRLAVMDRVDFEGTLFLADGALLTTIQGLNRPRLQDELVVYTSHHGTKTNTNAWGLEVVILDGVVTEIHTGNSTIPPEGLVLSAHGLQRESLAGLRVGDAVEMSFALSPAWDELGVTQIIGGGPRLVRDGRLQVTGEEERFRDDILVGRAPRTAIGITADHKLLLVTVNGRQPHISVGMTLNELGNLLIELGALQAMNLDGGGSTTMVIRNMVLNLPSDGKERPVGNAIVVVAGARPLPE